MRRILRMNHVAAFLCVGLMSLLALMPARGDETSKITSVRRGKNASIVPGYWHLNLDKCKKYARDNGVPLIAVWSNGDKCGHCFNFEKACNNSTFKNWMKKSGCVFYFTWSGDSGGQQGGTAYKFCDGGRGLSQFPFVRVYWYVNGKKKVDVSVTGDTVDGGFGGSTGAKKAVNWFKKQLKAFKPVTTPKYTGGSFDVGDTELDHLEAEVGKTTEVDVPLVRASTVASIASTNTLQVVYPNNSEESKTIYWSAGGAETNVSVDVSKVTSADAKITLILLDVAGKGVATNHIWLVSELENSPVNPLKVNEKTTEDLEWGEWTMDIDAATNKVKAYNKDGKDTATSGTGVRLLSTPPTADRAYTLVLLEGSLWCPDCKNTETNLLAKQEFKDWAKDNKIALVAIDLPKDGATPTAPTLLSSDPFTSDKTKPYYGASGKAYLSRKGIGKEEASKLLARNFEIAQKLRLPNWSNAIRPPVPSFFLLRDDGTVAARNQYFGRVASPKSDADVAAHIMRFNEMLAQAEMPEEEANDSQYWTTEQIGIREVVGTNEVKSISFTDSADVYRLDPESTMGKRMAFTLTGETNATVQLKLIQVASATASVVIDSKEGNLSAGVTLGAIIPSTNCYVSVGYPTNETYFSVASAKSTVCPYTLASDFVVEPTELAVDNTISNLTEEVVTVALVSNQLYRITNLDLANEANLAALVATNCLEREEDIYLAQTDGDIRLTLTASTTEIQKWNPGTVGFASQRASVAESAASYLIRLVRSGGASGRATAKVSFKAAQYPDLIDQDAFLEETEKEIVWEEGDTEAKTVRVVLVENTFADGNQPVVFGVEVGEDANKGIEEFTLTIRDNDRVLAGRVAIVATTPSMAKAMTVFARAGSDVTLKLERVDGSTGIQEVKLSASDDGTLDAEDLVWSNRIVKAQDVCLTLPDSDKSVKVTLTPNKGSAVDSARRILTVKMLDANAPGFKTDALVIPAVRYVPVVASDETSVELDDKATDETVVKKFSGSLPPGVTWSYDKASRKLVFAGVPSKAGSFTAVFRASTGKTEGLTVAVTVYVTDPVLAGGGAEGDQPLNAAVAKTCTYPDIPVFFADTNRLAGVLTLTLPRSGRASAKFRSVEFGTVTLSSKSWDCIDEGDGTLVATLTGKAGSITLTNIVSVAADGTVELDLGDDYTCILPETTWTKSNPATDFKGYYTVNLHPLSLKGTILATGDGYLTLKMNTAAAINIGKFTYAGMLPNGQAVSGSAVLTATNKIELAGSVFWERGLLPIVSVASVETLAGLAQITPGAWDPSATNMVENGMSVGRSYYKTIRRSVRPAKEAEFLWSHVDKTDAISGETVFDVNGTYYVQTENFAGCCVASVGTSNLKFFLLDGINALPDEVMERLTGETVDISAWSTPGVKVISKAANKKKTSWTNKLTSSNTKVLSMSFSAATGVVSGSFKVDGVKMTYKGVAMPGWGAQDCSSCSPTSSTGGIEATQRPFVSGAAWFTDVFNYDADGREREAKVLRSLPFTIGVQAGE